MDIQKEREAFLAHMRSIGSAGFMFELDEDGNFDDMSMAYAWSAWQAAKAQAVPEGFVLVPKTDVYDHYIANHLKGTTCSVDVSELTGNDGDRIYGKLRQYDCLGSDGNTLIYDLESSNFKLGKRTGNTGDYVLVPKEPTEKMIDAGVEETSVDWKRLVFGYKAMIDEVSQ
ncbi:hypothetical protein [Acinetobacter thermotolerans]|uniref:hypothetical protein n=1 Tax=Acinetobacter thermotolerans TaxID=3151487 RepID=UPI00325BBD0E